MSTVIDISTRGSAQSIATQTTEDRITALVPGWRTMSSLEIIGALLDYRAVRWLAWWMGKVKK